MMTLAESKIRGLKICLLSHIAGLKEHLEYTEEKIKRELDNPAETGFNTIGVVQGSGTTIDNYCGMIAGMVEMREISLAEAKLKEDEK